MIIFIYLLISITGLIFSACFSGFENGMLAIRQARLDHAVKQGSNIALKINYFLDRPSLMLATILLGNNLCNVFTAIYVDELLKIGTDNLNLSQIMAATISILASVVLTIIVLIFGEITPKVWFRQRPFQRCSKLVYPMYVFYILAWPFVRMLTSLVKLLNRLFPGEHAGNTTDSTMLRESASAGLIGMESLFLLENALQYDETRIGQLMVKKEGVVALNVNMTLSEALRFSRETNISRFPVYKDTSKEKWIGTFSIYDALFRVAPEDWDKKQIRRYIRPITHVSTKSKASNVLQRSKVSRSPLLVVVDNDMHQLGIITPSDIVQHLFGELNK